MELRANETKIKCEYGKLEDIHKLIPNPKNPNKHPDEQIKRLSEIIDYQGMRSPIVVSKRSGFITKGHGRLEALKLLGWDKAPVDYQDYDDEAQEYADIVADNAIAEWSIQDLSEINAEILDLGPDFDIDLLGLKDFVIEPVEKYDEETEDNVPELKGDPITKKGDVWLLGDHRVMCGDSTVIDDVEKLMNGEKADLLHTDPPYNVNYSNADRPKAGKTDFGHIKNDKMDDASFYQFLYDSFVCGFHSCGENSMAYVWCAALEHINFTQALIDSGWGYNQQIIWKKPMLLGRGKYQWAHEPCLTAVKGKPFFTGDRTKTTLWDFGGYDKSKNVHPTQKPVVIPEEAVNNSSEVGGVVLDLFLGSGSTLIACEKTNRKCYGMELDEHYCDVIVNRYIKYTGDKNVTLESTGERYVDLEKSRV